MLYGLDEEEEESLHYNSSETESTSLITIDKLNIVKILIVLAIVIVLIVAGILTWKFFAKNKDVNNDDPVEEVVQTEEQGQNENQEGPEEVDPDVDDTIYDPDKASQPTLDLTVQEDDGTDLSGISIKLNGHLKIPTHSPKEFVFIKLPVANPDGQKEIKDIYYSDEKQVYLTFDDGPTKAITPQVLDILKEYDVPATFFVLGSRVEMNPDLVKREFNEGHYIANHGYSHLYSQIYQSRDTTFEEYVRTESAIKQALNNQDYNSYLFRFPGGSSGGKYAKVKAEAKDLFAEYGVANTNWNCLTGDAEGKNTKEACINELIRTIDGQNSIIVLMHDASDKTQTVEALPEIIEYLKQEGYKFKNFYDVFCEKEVDN